MLHEAPTGRRRRVAAIAAALLLVVSLAPIIAAGLPLERATLSIAGVPVEVMALRGRATGPAVVIAHGFAGSRQAMYTFGYTLAHHGYTAYLLDFDGHGANPRPLAQDETGAAPDPLQENLDAVVRYAAARHPGVALLGHSMGGGAVIRYGAGHPEVAATIALSAAGGQVTPAQPRNLLLMVGAWEFSSFREGSLNLLRRAGGREPGVLYGDAALGTARRYILVPGAEHVLILLSPRTLTEVVRWLDGTFGVQVAGGYLDSRLLWLALAYLAALLLTRPLAQWLLRGKPSLPALSAPAPSQGLALLALAAIGAPILARFVPDGWAPLAVAGYVANYLALYGLILLAGGLLLGPLRACPWRRGLDRRNALGALGLALYLFLALALLGHLTWSALIPIAPRLPWAFATLPATLLYFAGAEPLIRGQKRTRDEVLAELAHKGLTLASLGAAIFMLGAPPFLGLLLPILAVAFAALTLIGRWAYRAGGSLLVGPFLSALAVSWLLAALFPLVR